MRRHTGRIFADAVRIDLDRNDRRRDGSRRGRMAGAGGSSGSGSQGGSRASGGCARAEIVRGCCARRRPESKRRPRLSRRAVRADDDRRRGQYPRLARQRGSHREAQLHRLHRAACDAEIPRVFRTHRAARKIRPAHPDGSSCSGRSFAVVSLLSVGHFEAAGVAFDRSVFHDANRPLTDPYFTTQTERSARIKIAFRNLRKPNRIGRNQPGRPTPSHPRPAPSHRSASPPPVTMMEGAMVARSRAHPGGANNG
jgi:hypothetical protein